MRSPVTMSAEADRPGLSSLEGLSRVTTTLKSLDSWVEAVATAVFYKAELPISVTRPLALVGKASTRTLAWPSRTPTTRRSRRPGPRLHHRQVGDGHQNRAGIVHGAVVAISPSSMRLLVIMPSMGEE